MQQAHTQQAPTRQVPPQQAADTPPWDRVPARAAAEPGDGGAGRVGVRRRAGLVLAGAAAVLALLLGGLLAGRGGLLPAGWPGAAASQPAAGTGVALAAQAASAASAAVLAFTPAEVVAPQWDSLPRRLSFSGGLVAPGTAVLRAKAGGRLLSLTVAEGDRVQAGQLLGQIEQADLASRIAERDANLAAARATLAQAQRSHAANEQLAAQAFISGAALQASQSQLDTARASLAAVQATLDTTRGAQRDSALRAPISGIVAKRQVLPGEQVSVEQAVLTVVDLSRLELAGSVATHEVSLLQPGLAVQVQVEGLAQPLAGKLARIAPVAEPGTRAIGVAVVLDNPGERLRAGQYAQATVQLADGQRRLMVPLAALEGAAGPLAAAAPGSPASAAANNQVSATVASQVVATAGNRSAATAAGPHSAGASAPAHPAAAVADIGTGQDRLWLVERGRLVRRVVTLGQRDEAGGRVEVLAGIDEHAQVLAARFDNLREGADARVVR